MILSMRLLPNPALIWFTNSFREEMTRSMEAEDSGAPKIFTVTENKFRYWIFLLYQNDMIEKSYFMNLRSLGTRCVPFINILGEASSKFFFSFGSESSTSKIRAVSI